MRFTIFTILMTFQFSSCNALAEELVDKDCYKEKDPIKCLQEKNKKSNPDDKGAKPLTVPVGADFNLNTK